MDNVNHFFILQTQLQSFSVVYIDAYTNVQKLSIWPCCNLISKFVQFL